MDPRVRPHRPGQCEGYSCGEGGSVALEGEGEEASSGLWLMLMLSLCPIAAFLHGFLFAGGGREGGGWCLTCLEGGIHKAHEEVTRGN